MMPLELRPPWCLDDEVVRSTLVFSPWVDTVGRSAISRDGDDWTPGDGLCLVRSVQLAADPHEVRRHLGLPAGALIGLAARWSCRATGAAGVHTGGPKPVELAPETELVVEIPPNVGGSIELETCLVVNWAQGTEADATCPSGALVWSDGWTVPASEREVVLEGAEGRISVRFVSFKERFARPSGALWAIDIEAGIEPEDLLSNVVTVLVNRDVLERDFRGADGTPDTTQLPPAAIAGIQVDLVRSLTATLGEELGENPDPDALGAATVGSMLARRLTETFGSVPDAVRTYHEDQSAFSRELWHRFAPDSWRSSR